MLKAFREHVCLCSDFSEPSAWVHAKLFPWYPVVKHAKYVTCPDQIWMHLDFEGWCVVQHKRISRCHDSFLLFSCYLIQEILRRRVIWKWSTFLICYWDRVAASLSKSVGFRPSTFWNVLTWRIPLLLHTVICRLLLSSQLSELCNKTIDRLFRM